MIKSKQSNILTGTTKSDVLKYKSGWADVLDGIV